VTILTQVSHDICQRLGRLVSFTFVGHATSFSVTIWVYHGRERLRGVNALRGFGEEMDQSAGQINGHRERYPTCD
jgi:hypothetical protein